MDDTTVGHNRGRMRRAVFIDAATLIAGALAFLWAGAVVGRAADRAADFSISLYQGDSADGGESLGLSELRGKPVIVNFWAVWCGPCREEMPIFEHVYRDYGHLGLTVVGVDMGLPGEASEQQARDFIREIGVTYPVGIPPSEEARAAYGVSGLPVTVCIDRRGKIASRWSGAITDEALDQQVRLILAD
ncbi:MAG: TlpA family protein disulfide reductase [SAR202 cluster bacterium]|nr:TlpA family protein disulfide reductase [SAR202 cluster bacterium]